MAEVPTLLIGLGGIGSRVVDTVHGWIPPERRQFVAAHAFDTNVNDISKLRGLQGRVTQTSERWTVGQYLHRADPLVKEWFPAEQPELQRKLLTEGAGQIRAVSRLAYRASMETGRLHLLERQIATIFRARGDEAVSSVRVMIVSSLAGGTGAGVFLQTAMYLRELFELQFGRSNVLVRGAFILPDVLIKSRVLDQNEWENVMANGYASLKELNAITLNAGGGPGQQQVTIEMEYRPGQTDASGRQSLAITPRQLPYDFVFLYDFENTRGENLGHLDHYLDQVAQTVFLQLFTPIAAGNFSQEDNQILSLIANHGRSRYAGAGVSRLIYPYDDVVEYSALRWVTDSLTEQWLKLDADYEAEYRQYERDLQAGVTRQEPRVAERYTWLLDNYAAGDRPDPFFTEAHRATQVLDEKGRPTEAKHALFLGAVEQEVERVLQEDRELAQAQDDCRIDEGRLEDRDRVRHEVIRVEDALVTLQQRVQKAVEEYKVFLVNQVLLQDYDAPGGMQGQDFRLNTWLLGKPEPLHPVAARYVLYRLWLELDTRVRALSAQNEELLKTIRRYERAYDLAETEDLQETAEDRVRKSLDQGFLKAVLRNEFKEFRDEYLDKSQRHLRSLTRFKVDRLKELVFAAVQKAVRELLDEWERYFRNLRETRNHLLDELHQRAAAHEGGADPTQQYVLGAKGDKEKLWDGIRTTLAGRTMPVDIARQIWLGHYRRFCEVFRGGRAAEQRPEATEALFRQDVLRWCRNEVLKQDALRLNVVRALRKEADFAGADDGDAHVAARVGRLTNLARPWVPEVPGAAEIHFWGIHPESTAELQAAQRNTLFGSQLLSDEAFSPFVVVRYRGHYGLKVEDFPKFSSGSRERGQPAGTYFRAYTDRIARVEAGNSVTPHLDKRWHLQAFLPDLNPAQAQEDEARVDRAWLDGLIYGYLKVASFDGRPVWEFNRETGTSLLVSGGSPTPGKLQALHEALRHNPSVVEHALERAEEQAEADRRNHPEAVEPHRFHQGCVRSPALGDGANVLDLACRFLAGAQRDEALEQKQEQLLASLLDEIEAYYVEAYGGHRSHTARTAAAALIESLAQGSPTYTGADPGSYEFRRWKNVVDNKLQALRAG
ncbi:MAG TPA: tubulin-like doman-containing protein [Longimicrobiaceae bacterium]|nr:tubulin-like doman-containing protein [Longimicrobiaceae bacterium]